MNRFRRRPPEVSAVLWTGVNLAEVYELVGETRRGDLTEDGEGLRLWMGDSIIRIHRGEWLVLSGRGVFWVMGGDEFRAIYEPLPPSESEGQ